MGEYVKKIGMRRILIMLLGNVFLGMGVSIFKFAGLGNDAYNAMMMALSDVVGIPYARFFAIFSVGLFVIELIAGRHFIGLGTIINTLFLGYIATFFYNIWDFIFTKLGVLLTRIPVMVIGVIICSLGVSMYQRPDVGVSPYDSLSLIMDKKLPKISYFWCRMSNDVICALVAYFAGGLVGIGTVIAAFGLGPIVHFFNIHVTDKLLQTEKHSEN